MIGPLHVNLPAELTAENGAKSLLSGEFYEEITEWDWHTEEFVTRQIPISWTTIKAIYARVVKQYNPQIYLFEPNEKTSL